MTKSALSHKRKLILFLGCFFVLSLVSATLIYSGGQGRSSGGASPRYVPLFISAGTERAGFDALAPQAARYRFIQINPLVLRPGGIVRGDWIFVSPFADQAFVAMVDRINTDVNGVLSIRGRIEGTDGYFLLSTAEGRTLGTLVVPEEKLEFEISGVAGRSANMVQEFEPGARVALEDGPSPVRPPIGPLTSPSFSQGPAPEATATRIDVMIVYTPAAQNYADASSGIKLFIAHAMEKGQLAMDNSLVNIQVRLVRSALVNYTESGSSNTDLDRLTNMNDGYMDEIHQWRNTYGADIVQLFTKVDDTGGMGWLLDTTAGRAEQAFSIGRIQQINWSFTSIHEIGHNMGCGHRKDQVTQPGPGLFSYSAGWRWIGSDGHKYCSVMSYQDDYNGSTPVQVGYFSNPNVRYKGTPTGNAVDGDNARTLRETKGVVSNYRLEAGTNKLTISAGAGGTTNPVPGSYIYSTGSVVRLTALPQTYFKFLNWSGDASGTQNPIDITVDYNKSITANFQRNIYAPSNAEGQKVFNRSLSQAEYVNIITFEANPANVNIISYKIYRVENGQRTAVATLDANTFKYLHHGVLKDQQYIYQIVAVNNEPREGDPAVVVIR